MAQAPTIMDEREYRGLMKETLERVERVFEDVDPDLVECEQNHGALTLSFADGSRCILSAQPSVRQLWLAVAARGIALHFVWDAAGRRWMDDKGKGIEVFAYLEQFLKEQTGQAFKL
jgi:CyaY protein